MAKNPQEKPPSCNPQWSMLPKDILELILARLDLAGHARFASVCSWWRWVAVENPPTNKPLALVLSHNPSRLVRRLLASFWPSWVLARFIGCHEEWLVVLKGSRELFLLSVASREKIQLPPPPRHKNRCSWFQYKAVLSSPPSSGNCTIVLRQGDNILSYCKLGEDKSFTTIYRHKTVWDMVFYKEQLYVVDGSHRPEVFDSGLDEEPTMLLPPLLSLSSSSYYRTYLTVSCDKLLVVVPSAVRSRLFELDPGSGWVEVGSLEGDNMLLMTYNYCLALPARGEQGDFRRNHVYKGIVSDYSSFSLDDGAYESRLRWNTSLLYFTLFNSSEFYRH